MFIADAQAHIWQRVRPGAEAQAHRAEPFGADELLMRMNEAGVQRAVLVPTSWSDDNGNELALAAAQAHPDRFGVFGVLPLEAPDGPARVARWRAMPGMLGIRASFHTETLAPLLTNGAANWLWPAAEQAGVPLMVYAPGQLTEIGRIGQRYPGLKLAIDHLAQPRVTPGIDHRRHVDALLALAHLPNVCVKASAMPQYSQQGYPFRDMHEHVCRVLDAFGPRRVFWGSDLTRLRGVNYRESVTMFTEELACLGASDRESVMGRALCDWMRWGVDSETPEDAGEKVAQA